MGIVNIKSFILHCFTLPTMCLIAIFTAVGQVNTFAESCQLRLDESHIGFEISQFGIGVLEGQFNQYDIACTIKDNTITTLSAYVSIESIKTGNKTRDRHLQSKPFFYSKKYPYIIFTLSRPLAISDQIMYGTLEMRGVQIDVAIPVLLNEIVMESNKLIKAEVVTFDFNRSDFGLITYQKLISNLVQSKIHVTFSNNAAN